MFFDMVENTVGTGENGGYQQFLLFPCFQKVSVSGLFNPLPDNKF